MAIFDVEGKALGQAGSSSGQSLSKYRAPVLIENDIAGEVLITVNTDTARAAHRRFIFSLAGLTLLLALSAYGGALQLGKHFGSRLRKMADDIALEDEPEQATDNTGNELELLNGGPDTCRGAPINIRFATVLRSDIENASL